MHARGFGITGNGVRPYGIHLMLKGCLKQDSGSLLHYGGF